MSLTRRQFLWAASAAGLTWPMAAAARQRTDGTAFRHGVASGDPQADAVILWTRVTPAEGTGTAAVTLTWRVAADPGMVTVVRRGEVTTSASRDYTVKVDVRGLAAGRTYYYAFESDAERSPVGRTRTLPAGAVSRLRFASISCANFPAGFFNVYRILAARDDLDAVIHLGDYIYEFANGEYGDGTPLKRLPRPLSEAVTLADYRQRYATYREDADLQAAHQRHPFIAVWDDHEIANDAWSGGATNHNPDQGEGDFAVRRAAAWKAYLEWMPIREQPDADIKLYRTFRYGALVDLVMLDTRGLRDRQAAPDDLPALTSVNRHLMGATQEAWFYSRLTASQQGGVRWQLIGQQILFSRLMPEGRPVQNADAWDGYQAERERVLDVIQRQRLRNVVILAGDIHSSWAFDVPRTPWSGYDGRTGEGSLAVELVTPAVSSPGLFTPDQAPQLTAALRTLLPTLKYLEGQQRGYVLLDVTPQRVRADWYHALTVDEPSTAERLAASFVCEAGSSRLALA
jgi:alkaline phosphatase D